MRTSRKILALGLAIAVVAGAAYAVAGFVASQQALAVSGDCRPEHAAFTPAAFRTDVWLSDDFTYAPPEGASWDPSPYLMSDYVDVTFPARDDPAITIHGWWVPGPSADAPAVIVVHGQGSCRRDPTILVPAGMLHRQGFGVLLIDMRDSGDSTDEDGRYGFGSDEYRDVLGAWDWLVAGGLPSGRIGAFGDSGGAAAVVVAMGEEGRLAAGWEESGAADLWSTAREEARRRHLPEALVPPAIAWTWLLGDDVVTRSPIGEAARIGTRPLQVVHGTADQRVSPHHATDLERALTAGNPAAPAAWLIDGAHHVQGPFVDPAEYERRLGEFFRAALGS